MNFTLHQLQVFQKVAKLQSITKAAEELHLTQPAVSIQLRNFQEQFASPLIEVVGRKLYLTDFGKQMLEATDRILLEVQSISQRSAAYLGELTGTLRISVVSTGKYVMPYFLSGFLSQNPGVDLQLDVTNKSQVVSHLERNVVDFALVSLLPEQPKLERISLMSNKLFLIGSGQSNFKRSNSDSIFTEVPIILREPGSATRLVAEGYFKDKGLSLPKKLELTSNEAVKQAVLAGLGCSIMPIIGLKHELEMGELQIIPVKGFPIVSTWNLVWPKSKKHSPLAEAFLTHVTETRSEIIHNQFSWFDSY
ncbi:MAG TPA: LysR family transcriptional regulator [Catalimonadaceae bacterium]|nr:LysR family transcriptional regulator [Catalimonadaceae bacterium]